MSADIKQSKRAIAPFDGEKYSIWKYRVRALIAEEDALCVLDRDRPERPDNCWLKGERIAKGIIIAYLSDIMLSFSSEEDTAKDIIDKLDAIYHRTSLAVQLSIEKKLLLLKFKEDMPLCKHFLVFDEMVLELGAAGSILTETSKIARLLLSLPSSYDPIVTAIHTQSDENLKLAFVKIKLLDYEVKLKSERSETSHKILQTQLKNNSAKTFAMKRKNNFKMKSFPHQNKKRKFYGSNNYRCENCGRRNHVTKDCFYLKNKKDKQSDRERTLQMVETFDQLDLRTKPGDHRCNLKEVGQSIAFMTSLHGAIPAAEDKQDIRFILDSGATDHIVNDMSVFTSLKILVHPINISVAKMGETIEATGIGSIDVTTNLGINGVLDHVLYVPEATHNLLSVRRMQELGMNIIFSDKGKVLIKVRNKTVLTGKQINNLICVMFMLHKTIKSQSHAKNIVALNAYKLWHERLGHISKSKFVLMKQNNLIEDNEIIKLIIPTEDLCEACIKGKQVRLPFSKDRDRSHVDRPLYVIHSDVCGPIKPVTIDHKNYFVSFIDEFTHYTVIYLLENKSHVFKIFQDFVAKSETHFNLKIAYLNCDNGGEYLSNEFKSFCVQKGIQYHLTVPYTPQQNSIAERMNRTLLEKARAMIHGAELSKEFWGEAILTATHLLNMIPSKAISFDKTPYELWHKRKPKLNLLKVFGSTVYIHNKIRESKFDSKSIKGIFVGYEKNGYKVFDTDTGKFIIARDVIFDEANYKNSRPVVHKTDFKGEGPELKRSKPDEQLKIRKDVTSSTETSNNSKDVTDSTLPPDDQSKLRRSERIKNKPHIVYNEESCYHMYALSEICEIPQLHDEIKNREDKLQWEKAIKDELDSLLQNNTWSIVPRPDNKNIVDCKWVFNIKMDNNGNPCKYKARLVAKGFSQKYLVDYDETFAPVARMTTFRVLIAFANQFKLLIHQMDVKTAFLNGSLKEEIYMRVPEGIKSPENHVCKLNKAIYGLKQSARCWFEKFDLTLKELGFQNSSVDRCLYFKNNNNICRNIYVILYVDDILICTYDMNMMTDFKNYLKNKFAMTDMDQVKLFLGIHVQIKDDTITLDQNKYLSNILNKFKMNDCNPVKTPLPVKLDYYSLNSDEYYDAPCRQLIGSLMYAMLCTRPDLCFAINLLSRFQIKNNKELWQNLKSVLRYIKGTLNYKLIYKRNDFMDLLTGYVDSDWAGNEIDRKSTTGYIFQMFDNCTICWNTKRQSTVATSSTEAEYMALYEGIKEACWLKSLISSINVKIKLPIKIFEDNNGCIAIANNPTDHKRTKHIDVKYHFSREKIEENHVNLEYISTGDQIADMFTKSIPAVQFVRFRTRLGFAEAE